MNLEHNCTCPISTDQSVCSYEAPNALFPYNFPKKQYYSLLFTHTYTWSSYTHTYTWSSSFTGILTPPLNFFTKFEKWRFHKWSYTCMKWKYGEISEKCERGCLNTCKFLDYFWVTHPLWTYSHILSEHQNNSGYFLSIIILIRQVI